MSKILDYPLIQNNMGEENLELFGDFKFEHT